jgi:hypothetical protein
VRWAGAALPRRVRRPLGWVDGSHFELFTRDEEAPGGPESEEEREVLAKVARLQDMLRAAVRACIEDEECRAVFVDADATRDRWRGARPPARSRKGSSCPSPPNPT